MSTTLINANTARSNAILLHMAPIRVRRQTGLKKIFDAKLFLAVHVNPRMKVPLKSLIVLGIAIVLVKFVSFEYTSEVSDRSQQRNLKIKD